MTLFCIAVG